jgi:hypothetical protein
LNGVFIAAVVSVVRAQGVCKPAHGLAIVPDNIHIAQKTDASFFQEGGFMPMDFAAGY